MKHLKPYKIFESTDFEPGVDLEYIDLFLEDIIDKGYDVKQYFGFKNRKAGELFFSPEFIQKHPHTADKTHDKLHVVDRKYIDNLIKPENVNLRRPHMIVNNNIYQDYMSGDMSYMIKIYSYIDEKGYTYDFPFGEITYSDIYGPLKQLIGYMSEERGLSYYKISATTGASKKDDISPWDFTKRSFTNIEDMKDVKVIGAMALYISKDKDLLPNTTI